MVAATFTLVSFYPAHHSVSSLRHHQYIQGNSHKPRNTQTNSIRWRSVPIPTSLDVLVCFGQMLVPNLMLAWGNFQTLFIGKSWDFVLTDLPTRKLRHQKTIKKPCLTNKLEIYLYYHAVISWHSQCGGHKCVKSVLEPLIEYSLFVIYSFRCCTT